MEWIELKNQLPENDTCIEMKSSLDSPTTFIGWYDINGIFDDSINFWKYVDTQWMIEDAKLPTIKTHDISKRKMCVRCKRILESLSYGFDKYEFIICSNGGDRNIDCETNKKDTCVERFIQYLACNVRKKQTIY